MEIIYGLRDLWREYDLTINLLSSLSAVYLSIIVSYFLSVFFLRFAMNDNSFFTRIIKLFASFSKYFSLLLIGIFLLFLFPGSEFIEYIFLIIYAALFILMKFSGAGYIKEEYWLKGKSLGLSENEIISKIIIKSIKPLILTKIQKLHINLWTMLIALEFFKEGLGAGSVFKMALDNRDLCGFVLSAATLIVLICLGSMSINYIHKKFFFWEY
jgi:ABC-type nitrate/sulfonate/bicarbonate transport system, permease component